jgi:hypothetical protein
VKLPEHRPKSEFRSPVISDFAIHVMTSWPRLGDKATNVTLPTIAGNRLHGMERAKGIEPSYAAWEAKFLYFPTLAVVF